MFVCFVRLYCIHEPSSLCYPCLLPSPFQLTDEEFWSGQGTNFGAVRSRAVAGQGQTVAIAKNHMRQNVGQVCSLV